MTFRHLVLNVLLAGLASGCGKTTIGLNHTLLPVAPGAGHGKATVSCTTASTQIFAALHGKPPFQDTHLISLANGLCAVQLLVSTPAGVLTLLDPTVLSTSKSYTYYEVAGSPVNVWVDDAPDTFKGPDGKVLDTSPSYDDCNTAKSGIANAKIADGSFSVTIDHVTTVGPRRCYVEALFSNEAAFKTFMGWVNPKGHGEPYHYYVTTNGITKVVYIHVAMSIPADLN